MTTLDKAMAAFVATGCDRSKMDVAAWATTFPPATMECVRASWEAAMTRHSQQQHNNGESVE